LVLALLLAIHVARRLQRPADYTAIALAAFASWAGLPGPGEAGVIAGAAFAARHQLDIVQVELFALGGAFVGGMIGWGLGWRFGAALAEGPGPLRGARKRALAAGERFYQRFGVLAIILTPSWVAGIHRVHTLRFIIFNLLACVVWTAGYGLTTYFLGPEVAEFFGNVGTWATIGIIGAGVTLATLAIVRRRRTRRARP
jgi:membrane protein DedA with SNARE-associated domain